MDLPLDHIAIAVFNIEESTKRFTVALSAKVTHDEVVESQEVKVRFLEAGEHMIELIEPLAKESPVHRFLEKRGEGLHHLAFRTKNIEAEMDRLRAQGFHLLQERPVPGANNKLIFFIHPKSMDGVLVEVCQSVAKDP